jgi:hypothetical protein
LNVAFLVLRGQNRRISVEVENRETASRWILAPATSGILDNPYLTFRPIQTAAAIIAFMDRKKMASKGLDLATKGEAAMRPGPSSVRSAALYSVLCT